MAKILVQTDQGDTLLELPIVADGHWGDQLLKYNRALIDAIQEALETEGLPESAYRRILRLRREGSE